MFLIIAWQILLKSLMLMGGKFVDEFSFKVVVYQRTLVQKVRITQNLKFVVKYEDFNMEQLTALSF